MFTAYVVVTVLTAAANTFAATVDFTRPAWLLGNMGKARVPQSWLFPLGALKAAGALGLLVGIAVPPLGVAASVGLVLFFIGALITHVRARYWDIAPRSRSSCWPWARWCCEWPPPEQWARPTR
jgi:DoxX-like protein